MLTLVGRAHGDGPPASPAGGSLEHLRDATVVVYGAESRRGSGFFIDATGTLLTNQHLVLNTSTVSVKLRSGEVLRARVLQSDANLDIAILSTGQPTATWLAMASITKEDEASEVVVVGTPEGSDWTVTTGTVSGILSLRDYRLIQTDVPVNPANSGGPMVLRRCGAAIAVISRRWRPSQGMGFAVDAGSIQRVFPEYIPKLPDRCQPATLVGSRDASPPPPQLPEPVLTPSPPVTPMVSTASSRPATGTILARRETGSGRGGINISNQVAFDAVVTLRAVGDKEPWLSLYVRAGEKTTVTDVVDGEYELSYRVGEGWTGVDFARSQGTFRLDQPLKFEDSFVVVRQAGGTTMKRVPSDPWNILLRASGAKR